MSAKSTTVRFLVKLGHTLAPAATTRKVASLFLSPRRSKRARAPEGGSGQQAVRSTVRSGPSEVAVYTWGQGPGILLVHGWEGRSTQFERFVEPLVRAGFKVVAMDLPAHGLSSGETTNLVRAARAIGDVTQLAGPFRGAVAHSFGGIALLLAHLESPVAERLVGIAPSVEPKLFVDRMLDFLHVPGARRDGVYREIESLVGRRMDEIDLRAVRGALTTPLLALHDPHDDEVPFAHGEAWAQVSRQGAVESVRDLGHRRILKDDAVISRACEFATGVPRVLELSRAGAAAAVSREEAPSGALRWENRSGTA